MNRKSGDLPGQFEYRLPERGQGFLHEHSKNAAFFERPGFLTEEAGSFAIKWRHFRRNEAIKACKDWRWAACHNFIALRFPLEPTEGARQVIAILKQRL